MAEIKSEIKCTCRLCLSNNSNFNIFDEDFLILRKIQSCFAIQISKNDGLPERICSECYLTLDIVLDFKSRCEESDKYLRNRISNKVENNHVDIKYEFPIEDDADFDSDFNCNAVQTKLKSDSDDASNVSLVKTKRIRTRKRVSKIKPVSSVEDKNLCPHCGKTFEKKVYLNNHLKIHNLNIKKDFECAECKKKFVSNWKLQQHMVAHISVKEFPCEICSRLFKTAHDAHRHVKIVHNRARAVECKVCGNKLATRYGLKEHMKIHTGEKKFKCDICKKQFTFRHSLIFHIRTHTGEKPYSCRFCDSKFTISKSLKDHERVHTGETPYTCSVCSKGFAVLCNLKSHFRNNHKGMEFKYEHARSRFN